ncbi:uncharacterized protein LOC135081919 [Ostrinia nubilalis]|uniref:uncharacterized protein LOC135081919 n=1 Tax=Ostrinia nubilalis TaxID=29057 RepID=UPI00308235DE
MLPCARRIEASPVSERVACQPPRQSARASRQPLRPPSPSVPRPKPYRGISRKCLQEAPRRAFRAQHSCTSSSRVKMNGPRSDASTSTDDLKDRPLCLFYFTHPFGVLSPEPPTVAAAPAHVARAFLNMEPVSPLHFWSSTADSYDTNTTASSDKLSFDLGNARVHKNPVNLVSVAKTRKCTIDLGIPRDTISSSLLSSDIWFSSGSSSRSYEYARRLVPYNRILPPLQLPAPQDTSTADSSDDLWPIKCMNPARFSLPPIKMPKAKVTKTKTIVNRVMDEVSSVESVCLKEVKCRKIVGVKKHKKRTHAAQLSGVRRMLTRLMRRAVKVGRKVFYVEHVKNKHRCRRSDR